MLRTECFNSTWLKKPQARASTSKTSIPLRPGLKRMQLLSKHKASGRSRGVKSSSSNKAQRAERVATLIGPDLLYTAPQRPNKSYSSSEKVYRKTKPRSRANVFCCFQLGTVSVLPLAWQAAPACFINTAQAALDENPRFAQVQLHSGELHYLQYG